MYKITKKELANAIGVSRPTLNNYLNGDCPKDGMCTKKSYECTSCYSSMAIEIVDQVAKEFAGDTNVGHKNGWIPCSEKLPEDGDHRFYMCIVENHEEDLPMFCQFVEELGFGYWQDIFDKDSLGFVDSEFSTNEELGYEKVIAWQPLPGPYEEKEND